MSRLLDGLLGPHCRLDCGQRIYPRDVQQHEAIDHAGDDVPELRVLEPAPVATRSDLVVFTWSSPLGAGQEWRTTNLSAANRADRALREILGPPSRSLRAPVPQRRHGSVMGPLDGGDDAA